MESKKCLLLFGLLLSVHTFSDGAVWKSPNNDDRQYWREFGEKHLKRILKSQGIKGVDVAKNVIFFVGDGMSFATIAAGRILKGQMQNRSGEETEMVFESFPHLGMSKTYNTDKQVPDSAGTATALFSGIKTKLGAICLNPVTRESKASDRLKTIIDWAQAANKRTGVVTTTRITHATPAATYAYAESRNYECDSNVPETMKSYYKDIARQLIEDKPGRDLNVIFGGGRDFLGATIEQHDKVMFGGSAEKSCNRTDQLNLVEKYLSQFDNSTNVKYVKNSGELMDVDFNEVDRVLGLFANNHMNYNSLRDRSSEGEPSLPEMTKAAIKILDNKKNKNGYLLIVEGGKIDQAHHQNHARLALEEMVEFDRAIKEAIEMTSDDTLIIVTADHAHSMVFNGYPSRGNDILGVLSKRDIPVYETIVYATGPGFWQHVTSNDTNSSFIPIESFTTDQRAQPTYMHSSLVPMGDAVHSGEDVGVFATGPGSNLIQGVFEQNYIPYVISYSSCIGPLFHQNAACRHEKYTNDTNKLTTNVFLLLTLNCLYILYRHVFL